MSAAAGLRPRGTVWSGSWVAERTGIALGDDAEAAVLGVRELAGLALRRNPRRAHLLVSEVLGKHIPVDPRVARTAGLLLGLLVRDVLDPMPAAGGEPRRSQTTAVVGALGTALATPSGAAARAARDAARAAMGTASPEAGRHDQPSAGPGVAWVHGFGETATGLGQAVAEVLGAPALHSTRRPGPAAVAAEFAEVHSHAQRHCLTAAAGLVRRPGVGVLVDDELSTGATVLAAIRAVHAVCPRRRYLVATLLDVRSPADVDALRAGVADLRVELPAEPGVEHAGAPAGHERVQIEVVALARGRIELPVGLPARAAVLLDEVAANLAAARPPAAPQGPAALEPLAAPEPPGGTAVITRVAVDWPPGLPDGSRAGLPAGLLRRVQRAAERVAVDVRTALGAAGLPLAGQVLVLGTEEHLDVPLRVAEALADALDGAVDSAVEVGRQVRFSSTTRSPVAAVDRPGSPVRTALAFGSHDDPLDGPGPRFAYNVAPPAGTPPWDAVVVVVDRDGDTAALHDTGGLLDAVSAVTPRLLLVTTGQVTGSAERPPLDPLRGPEFGSYAAAEVGWLLTDLSHARLEAPAEDREELIQSGRAHYAESLPVEYRPTPDYERLYEDALAAGSRRVAVTVGLLAGLLRERHGTPSVLVSLARAGTPVGILLRRWFATGLGAPGGPLLVPHVTISIVRGRGIDRRALAWVAQHHDPARAVLVDGWTGKGAIARELRAALERWAADGGPPFDAELAVLADPGSCTSLHGTREDWLIPSSCLNSTVSGLVSRTVLNADLIGPGDHHGAKFYAGLAGADRSAAFLDAVSGQFATVAGEVAAALPGLLAADRTPTWGGWAAVEEVAARFGIDDLNLVKPGVGETTRVLLRRVPWQILVRDPGHPDLALIEALAAARGVPVVATPDLAFACIGLIRPAAVPGTGADPAAAGPRFR